MVMKIGKFLLNDPSSLATINGETPAGAECSGSARLYELRGPDGVHLTLRDALWINGERDITTYERHQSPERFDTLVGRLRLSVLSHEPGSYVELQQARRRGSRAQTFRVDLDELDSAAGVDCTSLLIAAGATAVGSREDLLRDDGRRRGYLAATFADASTLVPVVAYVLTRVAPIAVGATA